MKLPSSPGAVPRNTDYRRKSRMQRVREYFYGPKNDMSPHSSSARFDELQVYRVGGAPRAPSSALPIGAEALLVSNCVETRGGTRTRRAAILLMMAIWRS